MYIVSRNKDLVGRYDEVYIRDQEDYEVLEDVPGNNGYQKGRHYPRQPLDDRGCSIPSKKQIRFELRGRTAETDSLLGCYETKQGALSELQRIIDALKEGYSVYEIIWAS